MADLNKLRQTKEYQNTKGYEDNEKLNKYYDETWSNAQEVMAQQIDEELEEGIKEMVDKHAEQMAEIDKQEELDELEQAKCSIAEKITKHFDDVLFEMVCQEMGNNYLFQSDNYLTEAGYDMFEDEWFEFYHEHHGDILYRVKHNLFE